MWQYCQVCIKKDGVEKISQMHSIKNATKLLGILPQRKQRNTNMEMDLSDILHEHRHFQCSLSGTRITIRHRRQKILAIYDVESEKKVEIYLIRK